ncbi:hypothetical protein Xinn_01549 [Xenorhabdus innexi]|uniref:Transposase n=1 Tax=Xenorhabdus innexi TaxID=290109 RepID=A0A2G0NPF5_9GAMM|nr:hypothetical protein Xinn_01549 [Xenorhabdus innexi]
MALAGQELRVYTYLLLYRTQQMIMRFDLIFDN